MELSDVIQAVAKRHGTVISKNDPVLMVYTMLECFQKNMSELQEEERIKLVAALELEQHKWTQESRARAERILTASLDHARQSAAEICDAASTSLIVQIDKVISAKIGAVEQKQIAVYRLALANLVGGGLLALAGLFFWLGR